MLSIQYRYTNLAMVDDFYIPGFGYHAFVFELLYCAIFTIAIP